MIRQQGVIAARIHPKQQLMAFTPFSYRGQCSLSFALMLTAFAMSALAEETLPTIQVTATRLPQNLSQISRDVTVLNREQLAAYDGLTAIEVLRYQPELQIVNQGGPGKVSSVFIRGANASHTLVLIDGVRYGSVTTGTPALEQLPIYQIERIEVLRGPAASVYGSDAIGGVIQIFTRRSTQPGLRPEITVGAGNLGQRVAAGSLGYQDQQTRWNIGLADSRLAGVTAIRQPSNPNYSADQDGYHNQSASFSIDRWLNPAWQVGSQFLLSNGTSHYDSATYNDQFQPVLQDYDYRSLMRNGLANVWTRYHVTPTWETSLQFGLTQDDNRSLRPTSATNLSEQTDRFQTRQRQLIWQNQFSVPLGKVLLAAEQLQQAVKATADYPVDQRQINSYQAGFTGHLYRADLQANIRHDRNSQFGQQTTGTAGFSVPFLENWRAGLSAGNGFAAPSFNDLYFPYYGNAALQPERSRSVEGFLAWQQGGLQSRLTAYRNQIRDLIQYDAQAQGPANIGRALLQGLSWRLDGTIDHWLWGGSVDWLQAKDETAGATYRNDLPRRAARSATAYFGWQPTSRWQSRLSLQAQGHRFDDRANRNHLPGYVSLDWLGRYQANADWTVQLRVNNLLNQYLVSAKDYNSLGRQGLLELTWRPALSPAR